MLGESSNYVHSVSRDSNYIIYNNTVNGRGMNLPILYFEASLPKFDKLQAVSLTLDPDILYSGII